MVINCLLFSDKTDDQCFVTLYSRNYPHFSFNLIIFCVTRSISVNNLLNLLYQIYTKSWNFWIRAWRKRAIISGYLLIPLVQNPRQIKPTQKFPSRIKALYSWSQVNMTQIHTRFYRWISAKWPYSPCRNFSNFFLKTTLSVISVQILLWVSMRIFYIYRKICLEA